MRLRERAGLAASSSAPESASNKTGEPSDPTRIAGETDSSGKSNLRPPEGASNESDNLSPRAPKGIWICDSASPAARMETGKSPARADDNARAGNTHQCAWRGRTRREISRADYLRIVCDDAARP